MEKSYAKTLGGALKLKGVEIRADKKQKKSKKEKKAKKSKKRRHGEDEPAAGAGAGVPEEEDAPPIVTRVAGTGRIITSGTTVHGTETKFQEQLKQGDGIEVQHPLSLKSETRVVKLVLSNSSISISSPFSSDLVSSCKYTCLQLPKKKVDPAAREKELKSKLSKDEEEAFGTYASKAGKVLTYRVKKAGSFGGYQIVKTSTESALSREELLDRRIKHKSDRLCM